MLEVQRKRYHAAERNRNVHDGYAEIQRHYGIRAYYGFDYHYDPQQLLRLQPARSSVHREF